ncbi:MAG: zinc-dependent metalloprotease, partial [Chitinophagaceae bacterium]|nr:zinc-dependent metalloprotease [Chitinophagaceae bacterium]
MSSSKIILFIFSVLIAATGIAQSVQIDSTKTDTIIRKPVPRSGIKSFDQLISKSYTTKTGLFAVHQFRDTMYFEIPDSILKSDIEVINRLEQGPGGTGSYSGEELDEKTIRFERHDEDSSIRIRYTYVISSADPESDIYKS